MYCTCVWPPTLRTCPPKILKITPSESAFYVVSKRRIKQNQAQAIIIIICPDVNISLTINA